VATGRLGHLRDMFPRSFERDIIGRARRYRRYHSHAPQPRGAEHANGATRQPERGYPPKELLTLSRRGRNEVERARTSWRRGAESLDGRGACGRQESCQCQGGHGSSHRTTRAWGQLLVTQENVGSLTLSPSPPGTHHSEAAKLGRSARRPSTGMPDAGNPRTRRPWRGFGAAVA